MTELNVNDLLKHAENKKEEFELSLLDLLLDDFEKKFEISPYITYCNKTGQSTGTRDGETIKMAMALSESKDEKSLIAYFQMTSGPALHWLQTGPEQLTKLKSIDPYGFFMYCLGFYLRPKQEAYSRQRGFRDVSKQLEFSNSLAMGYESLKDTALEDILLMNEHWIEMLTYIAPEKINWHTCLPHKLCTKEATDMLKTELPAIFNKTMQAMGASLANAEHAKSVGNGSSIFAKVDRKIDNETSLFLDELLRENNVKSKKEFAKNDVKYPTPSQPKQTTKVKGNVSVGQTTFSIGIAKK
jgi:hypothetical protein